MAARLGSRAAAHWSNSDAASIASSAMARCIDWVWRLELDSITLVRAALIAWIWFAVRWYAADSIMFSRSVRVRLWILQIWTGVLVGSRRSSISWAVSLSIVWGAACSLSVVMRIARPFVLGGARGTRSRSWGLGMGLCAHCLVVSGY